MIAGRRYGLLWALLCSALAATSAEAQSVSQLEPGARLRVTHADPKLARQIGGFESADAGKLVLRFGEQLQTIPLPTIRRLEVSRGRQANVAAGAIGLVLGAVAGGLVGCAVNRDDYGVFCGGQSDTKVAAGAVIGGLTGAAVGAFVFRREAWRDVELGPRGGSRQP